jgi:cytochrome b involved in lipid metabolism
MSSKTISIIVVTLLVIFGLVAFMLSGGNSEESVSEISSNTVSNSPFEDIAEQTPDIQSYTKTEIAIHNNATDCWTIVNNNVYDITSYIPRHPGGNDILLACGTDGTTLFTQRKTTEGEEIGSGTAHSSNATNQLTSLQIGVLAQ